MDGDMREWEEAIAEANEALEKVEAERNKAIAEEAKKPKMEQKVQPGSEEETLMVEAVRETALRMLKDDSGIGPSHSEPVDWFALICLRFRKYDIRRAVDRLKNLLQYRCLMTPDNLSIRNESVAKVLGLKHSFILPGRDTEGRIMVYWSWDFAPNDERAEAIYLAWFIHWLMLDCLRVGGVDAQLNGITIIADLAHVTPRHNDGTFFDKIQRVLPVRVKKILLIHPGTSARLLVPLAKRLASPKLAARIHLLTDKELTKHIDKSVLLREWGGECDFDREAWANEQLALANRAELEGQ